ncbi:hypothetical protein J4G33_03690 [Actinotalea sp. BY-33]|uniref:SAF domain-containing protein n=1 Tax=Actinotalea soli TaxID=2819234 RepID=A0A939LNR4_9CELL|nr:hypothetical protein [Actinotalea soli]MBO1750898.1 hypothetical protein [Actinotalea soli]
MQTTSVHAPEPVGSGHAGGAPLPSAVRLRRPGWRDPRLLVGLVLVALSVALGSWLVATAGRTVPVLVARDALVPGSTVQTEDLDVRQVRLPEDGALYLAPGDELPSGLTVVRTVGAGELVPWTALSTDVDLGLRPLAVRPARAVSEQVAVGSVVELWHVPEDGAPQRVADSLTVAELSVDTGAFTVEQGPTVHVLVPVDDLPLVLGALAAEGAVELVHVPGVAGRP